MKKNLVILALVTALGINEGIATPITTLAPSSGGSINFTKASREYTGTKTIQPPGQLTVTTNGNTTRATITNNLTGQSTSYTKTVNGNTGTLTKSRDGHSATASITATSPTTGTVTGPMGYSHTLTKTTSETAEGSDDYTMTVSNPSGTVYLEGSETNSNGTVTVSGSSAEGNQATITNANDEKSTTLTTNSGEITRDVSDTGVTTTITTHRGGEANQDVSSSGISTTATTKTGGEGTRDITATGTTAYIYPPANAKPLPKMAKETDNSAILVFFASIDAISMENNAE